MVLMRLPATADTGVTQERVGWPSTFTVQAPHRAMPQPYLVPVRLATSRQAQSSGISSATSSSWSLPLRLRLVMGWPPCTDGVRLFRHELPVVTVRLAHKGPDHHCSERKSDCRHQPPRSAEPGNKFVESGKLTALPAGRAAEEVRQRGAWPASNTRKIPTRENRQA